VRAPGEPPTGRPSRPLRQAVLFVGTAYALCSALALALPRWELTPLVAAIVPVVAVAVTIPLTTPAGRRAAGWAGVGLRLPTLRGLLFAIALPAAVASASFAIALALGVVSLRGVVNGDPGPVVVNVAVAVAVFSVVFLGEEIGWRGYLLPRLATVMSGRRAALATGAVHAAFHLPLLLLTAYQSAGSRLLVVPMVMITVTAAGTSYAWLRWSTGSIGTVSTMHAAFNESMQRWSAATVATSPAALAYTTTETGLATMLLMIMLAGYLLTRQAAVFRAGAQESRALFVPRVAGDRARFVGGHP